MSDELPKGDAEAYFDGALEGRGIGGITDDQDLRGTVAIVNDRNCRAALMRAKTFDGIPQEKLDLLHRAAGELAAEAYNRRSPRTFKRMMDLVIKIERHNLDVASRQAEAGKRELHQHVHLHGSVDPNAERRRTQVAAIRRRLMGHGSDNGADGGDERAGAGVHSESA